MKKIFVLLITLMIIIGIFLTYNIAFNERIPLEAKIFNGFQSLDWLDEELVRYEDSPKNLFGHGENEFANVTHTFTNGDSTLMQAIDEEEVSHYYYYSFADGLTSDTLVGVVLEFKDNTLARKAYQELVVSDPTYISATVLLIDNYLISTLFTYMENDKEQPGIIYLKEYLQD